MIKEMSKKVKIAISITNLIVTIAITVTAFCISWKAAFLIICARLFELLTFRIMGYKLNLTEINCTKVEEREITEEEKIETAMSLIDAPEDEEAIEVLSTEVIEPKKKTPKKRTKKTKKEE